MDRHAGLFAAVVGCACCCRLSFWLVASSHSLHTTAACSACASEKLPHKPISRYRLPLSLFRFISNQEFNRSQSLTNPLLFAMLIVGLTGGISSGKSTVSGILKQNYGLTVVDADLIAREVVLPGKPAYNQIVAAFGTEIPNLVDPETKMLNRGELGRVVFSDRAKVKVLNSIVHPAVKKAIAWQIFVAYVSLKRLVIVDVPLLYESGIHLICGKVVTVTCDADTQLVRLVARNPELSEEDAQNRIANQSSNRERNARADIVIDNNGSKQDLDKIVQSVVAEITPNVIWTALNMIPGFVLVSAFTIFVVRKTIDNYKIKALKKSD